MCMNGIPMIAMTDAEYRIWADRILNDPDRHYPWQSMSHFLGAFALRHRDWLIMNGEDPPVRMKCQGRDCTRVAIPGIEWCNWCFESIEEIV